MQTAAALYVAWTHTQADLAPLVDAEIAAGGGLGDVHARKCAALVDEVISLQEEMETAPAPGHADLLALLRVFKHNAGCVAPDGAEMDDPAWGPEWNLLKRAISALEERSVPSCLPGHPAIQMRANAAT